MQNLQNTKVKYFIPNDCLELGLVIWELAEHIDVVDINW